MTDEPKKTGREILEEVVKEHSLADTFDPNYDKRWSPKNLKFKSPGRPKKYHTEEEKKAARNRSMAKYMKKRRANDPEFYEKQREVQRKWYEKSGRDYMREYMRKRYHEQKAQNQIRIDLDTPDI